MTGNPLPSLVLEGNVDAMAARFGANPRYFKTAIRTAFREKAEIVPHMIDVDGHREEGWGVTIMPFEDDRNKARMNGLDAMVYEFDVAKAVPGEIVAIHISAAGGPGGPLLEEKVDYVATTD